VHGVEPDFADELTARLDDEDRMRSIIAAARSLPDKQRDVLSLCDWSQLSTAEAALALGVSAGTVKSRLSRAREGVRNTVADLEQQAVEGIER